MPSKLHERLTNALTERSEWEQRQRIWYEMRHHGLKRRAKPFPGAADLHFPLVDTSIEKLKPFYLNAIFSSQQLCSFTALRQQQADATSAAAEYLDWQIRNNSNFEEECGYLIDGMLQGGRMPLKLRIDPEKKSLEFEAIEPIYFIVPKGTHRLEDADCFAHVKCLSVPAYQRDTRYNQDPELIQAIQGKADQDRAGKEQAKSDREGLTYSSNPEEIILWEVWEKVPQGWRVHTYSPSAPDRPVRPPFLCPYKMGGKPMLPFVAFQYEIKDKGWYAPRGVAERMAPFETYCTKLWNAKADFLEYCTKPLFTSTEVVRNTNNTRLAPGEVLPPGLTPAEMPQPPMSLDQEMQQTRLIGEQALMLPDFGVAEEGGSNKTATEVDYIKSFASQGVQARGRLNGRSLGEVYRKAWALLVQYGGNAMTYWSAESRKVLPPQARHDNYLIEPDASPDQWNKQSRIQRSVARLQMFRGHPNVNQEALVRSVIEDDDARLVKKLYIASSVKQGKEAEDEALEILLLMEGFPCTVDPGEDHPLRLKILMGKLQQLSQLGVPPNPVAIQRLHEHILAHLQALKEQNPALAKQIISAIQVVDQSSGAGRGTGAGGVQGGVVPGSNAAGDDFAPTQEPMEMGAGAI